MRRRIFEALGFAVVMTVLAAFVQSAASGQAPAAGGAAGSTTSGNAKAGPPPHTPWGQPDLQGIWLDEFDTPFERPAQYADKEFFTEDDRVGQEAAQLLDRLVRQGRAFGLHILLGSQTLGGEYSLPRSTIDQMAVRIALQCSDTDAQLILSKDNTAARLLSRPGEALYNDQNGLIDATIAGKDWLQLLVSGLIWLVLPLAVGVWRITRAEVK